MIRLRWFLPAVAFGACAAPPPGPPPFAAAFPAGAARVWIGPEFWANRLQDWQARSGRIEVLPHAARLPLRTVHLLTRSVDVATIPAASPEGAPAGRIGVRLGRLDHPEPASPEAFAGLLLGAGPGLDWRAASLVHRNGGPGAGLLAGIDGAGRLAILDLESASPIRAGAARALAGHAFAPLVIQDTGSGPPDDVVLELQILPDVRGGPPILALSAVAPGRNLGRVACPVPPGRLVGGLAVATHCGYGSDGRPGSAPFWFRDWTVEGPLFAVHDDRTAGPILSAQYTVSPDAGGNPQTQIPNPNGVLKLTAQLMPLASDEAAPLRLEADDGGGWRPVAEASPDLESATAAFRVTGWDASRDAPYRVLLDLARDGIPVRSCALEGVIRRDPADKPSIVVAGFTGNHNNRSNFENGVIDWRTDVWFPHADILRAVSHHDPDLLFFSGDQVYESLSPTRADTQHLRLDYLYKWYLWCRAFGELTRDRPCVTIPDDHDVYQGNLWGEGGRLALKDDRGGYVHPAWFVKMVERTQTGHLPDPPDPAAVDQSIGVYFTRFTWGRVGFVVLEDRKFKSGCAGRVPGTSAGRPDHVTDPGWDPASGDLPGLQLLGARQLRLLQEFAADWRGQDLKMALSQTVFAGLATHHGPDLQRLVADLDSNGWPQSGRNAALRELRRGFVFHLGGDQHLASLVHHGSDAHGDAGWSFAVPSIANFYPRAWLPETPGGNRAPGVPPHLGEHRDGLGNRVTVHAVTNPTALTGKSTGRAPLELHDRMPGYGIVRVNKGERSYTVECWPRYADPADPSTGGQYEGWPLTIPQAENYGRKPAAWLPRLEIDGREDAVVQVIEEATGGLVYALRIRGTTFRPPVFAEGMYTLRVGGPDTGGMKTLMGVRSAPENSTQTMRVTAP